MIGIVLATMLEAKPLIEGLALSMREEKPFRIYANSEHCLVVSGIGKVNAALATCYLAVRYGIRVFLNAGAAGALSEQCAFGEIYHVREVIEPDRPHVLSKAVRRSNPDVLEGFAPAVLATQDVPVIDADERKKLSALADLADMEGAAVLQAARAFGALCYIFKIVSDTAEHLDDRKIVENINSLQNTFGRFVIEKILKALAKTVEKIAVDDSRK